ncbi:DNA-binding transcriptional LysR family regulator [Pseudonocardia hierapolitana]|uniref:DNA-binding transcriptional LysR family regulator n=1 Tax=Pseudonocardia hierapolitana TaxID=1128676 RepID=A0A561SSE1_9PSEU|nr:LysR family transcriptional regulator [Pseudonocardia hierapolitana]TWF77786.1 DNA-binding transcriptional LysR family regulator [Pseudonocardia hierapolitana]
MTGDVLIRQLEYLVALAKERHFGRAAAACHVSQPALSAAIRRLEHELDVPIVLRGQRFGGFTPEGQRVVGWAHRILAERDGLRTDVDRMRGGLSATLRIGAIPTAVPATPLITARFEAAHPRALVRIEALSSREIARRLADFELDVGVTYLDDESAASMRVAQLYRERFLLLMPADDPLSHERVVGWAAAAELPLCALTQDMRNRRILDAAMATAGARLAPVMETDNVGALYAHIATGGLSSIVSHAWVHAFGVPAGSCVRPLADPNPNPPVGLVALPREPPSILVDAVWTAMEGTDLSAEFERSLAGVLEVEP